MKVDCEKCESRLECVGSNIDKELCKVAHESLHAILLEFCKRFNDAAIVDVTMEEYHVENDDTSEERSTHTSIGIEILPLTNGGWHQDGRWGKIVVDDGSKVLTPEPEHFIW